MFDADFAMVCYCCLLVVGRLLLVFISSAVSGIWLLCCFASWRVALQVCYLRLFLGLLLALGL